MKLFLDSSVLLAAAGSPSGASRALFTLAAANHWQLLTSAYCLTEVVANLPGLPPAATLDWQRLRPQLAVLTDVLTETRPTLLVASKDKPVLFTALADADVLLTLDAADFGLLLDTEVYRLQVLKPGKLLQQERAAGRLR